MRQLATPLHTARFFAGHNALRLRGRSLPPALVCLLFAVPVLAQVQPPHALQADVEAQAALDQADSGVTFIENRGQWDGEARYLVRVGGLDAWITDSGLVFDFHEQILPEASDDTEPWSASRLMDDGAYEAEGIRRGHVVRMQFEGAAASEVAGIDRLPGYHNYFIGNDPERWASSVPLYREVMVSELYEGVGMRLYDDGGLLRYDLLSAPGADLSQVRLRLEGTDAVWVTEEGDLAMATSLGEVRQAELLAYQEIDGQKVAVPAVFDVMNDGAVGFDVEPLDSSLPLVIDPLIYSTFLGGGSDDVPRSLAVDAHGHAFVTGWTQSANFPTTSGAYQGAYPGGNVCAFVTKLDASGADLVFSTFLGGADGASALGLVTDHAGNVFVKGNTASANFPTTEGAFQPTYPGGSRSAFVTKLSASGSELIYSTYLGGSGYDWAGPIAVDGSGKVFAAGYTNSANFPTTEGAFRTTYPGGGASAFITKLNDSGSEIAYSTFLGGGNVENLTAIALDAGGHVFMAGRTNSSNFPTTGGAYQTIHPGGSGLGYSAYVTKLDATFGDLVYSTFLGGGGEDRAHALALDADEYAVVAGNTTSPDFPTTEGAFQTAFPGPATGFVTKLSPSGSDLIYSTYIGGEDNDGAGAIAVDAAGNALLAGSTSSSNFPTTDGAYQTTHPGGGQWGNSAFVAKLDATGGDLVYSTFLGGADDDGITAMVVDASGNGFVAGTTRSNDFPTTDGAYQTTHPGGLSGFVTVLDAPVLVSAEPDGSLPEGFALDGAYPNPFAQTTRIRFAVSESATVTLEAFDLLGRRVATIADEPFEAGTHEREFDASALPSGVYVVRMTSGEFSQSRRVVVVR